MAAHLGAVGHGAVVVHSPQHRTPSGGAHRVAAVRVEVQLTRQHLRADMCFRLGDLDSTMLWQLTEATALTGERVAHVLLHRLLQCLNCKPAHERTRMPSNYIREPYIFRGYHPLLHHCNACMI